MKILNLFWCLMYTFFAPGRALYAVNNAKDPEEFDRLLFGKGDKNEGNSVESMSDTLS